ncbi:hypothetical protein ABFS83_09G033500 [Erythranthe nasuta]
METSLQKSVNGGAVKEEKKASHDSNGDEESCGDGIFLQIGAGKRAQDDDEMKPSSPNQKNLNSCKEIMASTKKERSSPDNQSESRSSSSTAKREQLDHQLGSTKAEMEEVMEENQMLKMYLDQILKDYRTLQMQYRDVIQHESKQEHEPEQEPTDDLISLTLGRTTSGTITERTKPERLKTPTFNNNSNFGGGVESQRLTLGLDSRFNQVPPNKSSPPPPPETASPPANPSPENSLEEIRQEAGDAWPPKNTKHARSDNISGGDHEEISQQNPTKRARVSVRVRCDTPTMNDGCQWRKYGQKIAKGNPCPRAYYRCTVAPSCPVRKQVQRCAEDMSILITTYEGTHNHPLPMSATAMASTTSAAASMLLSGSSTSGTAATTSTTSSTTLNGLNFYLSSDNSRSKPYYLPNPSISSTPSFPTITLDLTSTTNSSSTSSSSHLSRLGGNFPPRYSTTNLNFSSLESNPLPLSWNNGMLSYGTSQPLINKNHQNTPNNNSLSFGQQQQQQQQQQPYETLYQSYMQKNIPNPSQQTLLPQDTLAAATKAITSDPSFQSALAAALTSIIGSGGPNNNISTSLANQNLGAKSGQIISDQPFPILSSFPSTSNANKCAPPHLMNKSSSSTSAQTRDLMLLSPPFSNSKSKSNSPGDSSKDQV